MRKHLVVAAFAIAAALAGQTPAKAQTATPHAGPEATAYEFSARSRHRHGRVHRRAHHGPRQDDSARIAWATIRSAAGAATQVAAAHAGQFTAYLRDLEAHGARIFYMGGFRRGRCSSGSQHPCGKALDVCQDWRNHVSGARNCNLPPPAEMARIARAHGLSEGSLWCRNPDYGHAQVDATGTECAARGRAGHRYLATLTGKMVEQR
jgi:hypothetical protein